MPIPTAWPLIAAMTGLRHSHGWNGSSGSDENVSFVGVANAPEPFEKSAPAQNARPEPVTTTTRIESSVSAWRSAAVKAALISLENAFIVSGRLKVTTSTPGSWRSIRTASVESVIGEDRTPSR